MGDSYNAVLEALGKAASQNVELLKDAERQLKGWETQPGFYSTLLNIAFDPNLDINIRWLSILCAKNGVDMHWRNTITDEEKCVMKQKLLACLNEPVNQIALQSAVIISKIARFDFPNNWQELFPTLLNGIQSTDQFQQFHRLRAFLTGHHVVKTLASKRLMHDRRVFEELTATIFSTIFHQWIICCRLFMEMVQTDVTKATPLLESALLSLKMLKNLVVYGLKEPSEHPEAVSFLSLVIQQIRPFLECRKALLNQHQLLQFCEKYIILLVKVLQDVLDKHPYSFIQFIRPTLECSTTYCFNKDFQDHVFERLVVRFLNLIKEIILESDFRPHYFTEDDKDLDAVDDNVRKIKMEFFTLPALNEICQQLLSRYFLLSEKDLNNWENDPEDFAAEEKGECWKVSLRPCTEVFYLSLFKAFRELVKPFIVEIAKNMPIHNTNDIIASLNKMQINGGTGIVEILKKEAVYNAVGLAAFDLYDDIDFNKWFIEVLIPELNIKENGYYIIRRRVIWLIGQWCRVKMSAELRPVLYNVILESMSSDENLVVRLAAANTLKCAVDDFEFHDELFYPYLEKSINALFNLLLEVKDGDLKMSVLHVLSFIIERMRKNVQPYVNSLMQYLPKLWESCGDHNMLRCAIISCFVEIVKSLESGSESLQPFLIPMIALSTDVTQSPHVYLLEDGLELWFAILCHTTTCSTGILNLAQNLLPLLEYNNENLEICLDIVEGYILLSPECFLKRYGHELVKIFQSSVTDLKSEGINMILKVVEWAIIMLPGDSLLLFQPFFPFVLNLALTPDELPISLSIYFSLLCRVILHHQDFFINILQEKANECQKNVNILLGELFDVWLKKMPLLNPPYRRKLMGLALSRLLTSGSEIVHDRICGVLLAIVEVLNDITVAGGSVSDDTFVLEISKADSESADEDVDSLEKPVSNYMLIMSFVYNHQKRKMQAHNLDPVYTVILRDYFCDQMRALELAVGPAKFQDLMSTVDIETKQQVQFYLQDNCECV